MIKNVLHSKKKNYGNFISDVYFIFFKERIFTTTYMMNETENVFFLILMKFLKK